METPGAIPKTVPCLAQVQGGPAPLGSGGGSVPPDATLRAFASCHYAIIDNVVHTKKIVIVIVIVSPDRTAGQHKWNSE